MLREVFPGKELCTAVSADLAVAEGAAIRAAVLSGCDKAYLQGVLMLDVVPLAVGVELADGRFDPVIPKNARLPAVCSREYQLESPEQKGVTLELYEGDGTQERARDNLWVAHFNLPLIRLSPRQLAQYGPGRPRRVVVVLALGEDGALRARVDEADEDEGGSPWATMLLGLWVVLMAVLYVWCRVYFEPTLAEISGRGAHHLPATHAGGSDGSPSPPTSAFPNNIIIKEEEEEEDAWF
uniref:Uncharacterized protein n=1 Tax=Heterosigma akashiwo TaxID=2829 RepID=A0A7S3UWG3_HETAK